MSCISREIECHAYRDKLMLLYHISSVIVMKAYLLILKKNVTLPLVVMKKLLHRELNLKT